LQQFYYIDRNTVFIKVEGQKRGTGLINNSSLQDGELSLANIGLR